MPPKKRRQTLSHKAQLLFHQQPLEGPKHHYESFQQPITHTVQVPSKAIDQGTIMSWVLPQFDTTAKSQFPAHRKHRPRDQARQFTRRSSYPGVICERRFHFPRSEGKRPSRMYSWP
ncbi:RAD9, HUS1, RAD1-interacting nuclear orphan protein 1 [Sigmodon hispidus]